MILMASFFYESRMLVSDKRNFPKRLLFYSAIRIHSSVHLPRAAGVRILGVTGAGRAVPGRGADRPAGCSDAGVRGGARIAAARTGLC